MKEEQILECMGQVDEKFVVETAPGRKGRKWVPWVAVACILLAVAVGFFWKGSGKSQFRSEDVSISYVNDDSLIQQDTSKNLLIWLSEEEIFADRDTAIFKGTVTNIQNIVIQWSDHDEYRAIATIRVDKLYRGDCAEGEEITVLLPCPIMEKYKVEDTGIIAQLEIGMTGIFMPYPHREDSICGQGNATLYLKEVADYGLADGMRYAFLETDRGLVFADHAFETIRHARTLDQIEEYVMDMIEKTSK